jgi:hypothetical protein
MPEDITGLVACELRNVSVPFKQLTCPKCGQTILFQDTVVAVPAAPEPKPDKDNAPIENSYHGDRPAKELRGTAALLKDLP